MDWIFKSHRANQKKYLYMPHTNAQSASKKTSSICFLHYILCHCIACSQQLRNNIYELQWFGKLYSFIYGPFQDYKNLRNAFIYTASTQQRNGNFQQWLSYNALCLGKANPSHCILETMRPRASASSSSYHLTGRSLPAFFWLCCGPQEGSPAKWDPPYLNPARGCWESETMSKGCLLEGMHGSIPLTWGCIKPHQPKGDYIAFYRALYLGALCRAGSERAAQAPLPLPRTDCWVLRCHQPSWIPSQCDSGNTGYLCVCWAAALSALPPRPQGVCCPLCKLGNACSFHCKVRDSGICDILPPLRSTSLKKSRLRCIFMQRWRVLVGFKHGPRLCCLSF